jgi:hypothetical protein
VSRADGWGDTLSSRNVASSGKMGAGSRWTNTTYVRRVMPSCATTMTVMVVSPRVV